MTRATSTSWWKARVSRPITSMSAWVNSRNRPSCGRSPRHTFWIW